VPLIWLAANLPIVFSEQLQFFFSRKRSGSGLSSAYALSSVARQRYCVAPYSERRVVFDGSGPFELADGQVMYIHAAGKCRKRAEKSSAV
jgi:hypothetical protein